MDPTKQRLAKLMDALLSQKNCERLTRVFYDAAKIVYERQKRLKKSQLKMKEVSSALWLAETFHSQSFYFEATGTLAENFGAFEEDKALVYYQEKVMGSVLDVHKRKIVIDEDGMRSLYKEPASGDHVVESEFYEESRGKRLPWIRYTLERSEAIYVSEAMIAGTFRRTYLYTGIVSIPIKPKAQTSYYVVIVREEKNQILKFVTAYSMDEKNKFLRLLEPCAKYKHP